MNYRNHSNRCRHGFCLTSVGCERCGVKPDKVAARRLRRPDTHASPVSAQGYGLSETRGRGNRNAVGGGQ
jgi:hypothetical protein